MPLDSIAQDLLTQFLNHDRPGLLTDVDGTISHIARVPDAATVTDRSRDALTTLRDRLAVVGAISGRAAPDIQSRVGIPGLLYVGNHGLEEWINGELIVNPDVQTYLDALQAAKAEVEPIMVAGMEIEDKSATLSVHYRQTDDPAAVRDALINDMQRIADAHGIRLFEGRMIFELRPPLDLHKGTAFRDLIARHKLDAAIILGDDVTDVDAFKVAQEMRASGECFAFSVGVEAGHVTPPSIRDYSDVLVSGVSGVEELLEWLVAASSAS